MFAVRIWCLVLCSTVLYAQPLDVREKRDATTGLVTFADTPVADERHDGPILNEAGADGELERAERSADEEYDYVEDDAADGPEGRHLHKLKRKLKRKFKPHGGFLGGFGGYGGVGGHNHGWGNHHGGYGGWQQPYYGGGPIATAIAGPHYGGGGWNPGYGGYGGGGWNQGYGGYGGGRPTAQAASWNLGPFSIGWSNAGK